MLSLSVGFDADKTSEDFIIEMRDEIDECLNGGIMVFASASNESVDGVRTYPARYSRVICVHSANYQGKGSDFNPPPEDEYNFSAIGENIRPIWPSKTPKQGSGMNYRRGTSYATPVAVSIAAFMIGYIQTHWPKKNWTVKPWSPDGIKRMFKEFSVKRGEYHFISPKPFDSRTRGTIEADLRRCFR